MAVSATSPSLLHTGSSGSASSYNTASASLIAGRLYLLVVRSRSGSGTGNAPTVTGAGQTWVQVATRVNASDATRRLTVFRCVPAANNSGALTIDFAGQAQTTGIGWVLDEITGENNTGTNGAHAIVQSAGNDSNGANETSWSVTLAAFARSTNATYAALWAQAAASTITKKTGYTELANDATALGACETEFIASSDTGPSWTLDTRVVGGAIAIEINELETVSVAGAIDNTHLTGGLKDSTSLHVAGAIDNTHLTGAPKKSVNAHLAGAIDATHIVGALAKTARKKLAGAIDATHITGALTALKRFTITVTGGITPTGLLDLARRLGRPKPTLASVLTGSHTPVAQLLILSDDLTTILATIDATGDPALLDFSVRMDRTSDVHRQGSVSLANPDGLYSPVDPSSLIWNGRIARIRRGAMVGNSPQYITLMTGPISVPKETTFSSEVPFQVYGRLQIANRPFPAPLAIASGTPLATALRSIAQVAALGLADSLYDLQDGGAVLGSAQSYDGQTNMLTAMVQLANGAGCDLYDTGDGVIVLRPFIDPTTLSSSWTFAPGITSTLISLERQLNDTTTGAYNRVVVTAPAPDSYPIRAEAKVTNPQDPLYWTPDNDRPYFYTSPTTTTQDGALALAFKLLFEGATIDERITATAVPNPLIADRLVCHFTGSNVDDDYYLDTVEIPAFGVMTMTSRKVKTLDG